MELSTLPIETVQAMAYAHPLPEVRDAARAELDERIIATANAAASGQL